MTTINIAIPADGAAGDERLHGLIEDETWYDETAMVLPKNISVVGSAAERDFYVDIYEGKDFKGRFYNTSEGAATMAKRQDDVKPILDARPVQLKNLKVIQGMAPTSNVAVVELELIGG
jgi:hypothetical protein